MFQPAVLKKYLAQQDQTVLDRQYDKFQQYFGDITIQSNFRVAKESSLQGEFLAKLFGEILGYTLNPHPNFNLQREVNNETNNKEADGVILVDGVVKAVIELKDTKTLFLDKIEDQAFGYHRHHKKSKYIITSNYQKLRFYIDKAENKIEFDLFNLSREQFALLYLCLSWESIRQNLPLTILEGSVAQEENITKKLYADYSSFKTALFDNLCQKNPQFDTLTLFKKTQKLLDRFLFIFFAEDRGLLCPNEIERIIREWKTLKTLRIQQSLYERFKQYFCYLNTGDTELSIYAYNGGLFQPDVVLDVLQIEDNLLAEQTIKLAAYNFDSEVDVNILGHIFEHSLTETEEMTAELSGQTVSKQKGKRKQDGVYYTPKYITSYIVQQTVGKLCEAKRAELGIDTIAEAADALKIIPVNQKKAEQQKAEQKKEQKKLHEQLDKYRNWLLELKICDPACGSGAFLNQALEFLIDEHQSIDELHLLIDYGQKNGRLPFAGIETAILENNLYGVDINEESVEIAKLSLWLRSAEKGRQLNDLSNRIKLGNSLIDDPTLAGEKVFHWQTEFPEVFNKENPGFDVMIGNPPYVRLEIIPNISAPLSKCHYTTYRKRGDLYCLFVEQGFNLLNSGGSISFIMPNKWLQAGYGAPLRELLLQNRLTQLIDFGDLQIFEGATTYPCIFVAEKSSPQKDFKVSVLKQGWKDDFNDNIAHHAERFETANFTQDTWVISSNKEKQLLEKFRTSFPTLAEFVKGNVNYGIKTGLTKAFIIDNETRDKIITSDQKSAEVIKPVIQGRDIIPYGCPETDKWLICTFPVMQLNIDDYPAVRDYLSSFAMNRLKQVSETGTPKKRPNKWFETDSVVAYIDNFSKPKIMYQRFQVKPCFIYDETGLYCNDSIWIIPTENKGLLAILNSKMGWWLIAKYCTQIQNGYQLIWDYFGNIPLAEPTPDLAALAEKMISLTSRLQQERRRFLKLVSDNVEGIKVNRVLENFVELSFADFLKEMAKQKHPIPLKSQAEWNECFTQAVDECKRLAATIAATDAEIDRLVFDLYGLTEEEIALINENVGNTLAK